MTTIEDFDRSLIQASLAELNTLSQAEHCCDLQALLLSAAPNSALRLQRLVGIVLKRPFATEAAGNPHGQTQARRAWPWACEPPSSLAAQAPKAFALVDELRMPGPWRGKTRGGRTGP